MAYLPIHGRITNPPLGSVSDYISVAQAGDVFRVSPNAPIRITRWGFLATTTVNDATNALVLTCDLRPTAGSDVGRLKGATTVVQAQTGYNAGNLPAFNSDAQGGSITLTAGATQLAAGKGVYHDMNPQTGSGGQTTPFIPSLYPQPDTAFVAPGGVDTQFYVYPGQELVIAVQPNAPNAGAGVLFIEFEEMPNQGTGYNQLGSGLPASIVPTPSNTLSNFTRTQS